MVYGKFEMHYSAVEKTISIYFLIIAGIVSANGFFLKNVDIFYMFNLNDFQIFCCLFISILGTITTLKVIEHRILIIKYVKSLNLNRKWFWDNYGKEALSNYSIFKATRNSPKYYKKFNHFYLEILGLAIINSSFLSIFLLNIFICFGFESHYYKTINWILFIVFSAFFSFAIIYRYKKRGEVEDKKLENRNLAFEPDTK